MDRAAGRIELRGLRVTGHHGATAAERQQAQPFEIDLHLGCDLAPAGASDQLADTVDYGAVVAAAARVVSDESHHLLERLAVRVAEEVAGVDGRIDTVEVVVRKLRPPVPFDLASSGVRILYSRG